MRRLAAALAVAALVPLAWAAPAAADYQSTTETVWQAPGPGACLRTRAEATGSDVQGPYFAFTATAEAGDDRYGSCDTSPVHDEPPGWLAARQDVYRWDGSAWSVCFSSGWTFSDADVEAWGQTSGGGPAPCGAGWYGTMAFGAVYDGAAWQGTDRGVWSGYVWLDGGAQVNAPAARRTVLPS